MKEFEHVVVFTDSMNDNELYISYTRSLSTLCVVNDKFEDKAIETQDKGLEVDDKEFDFNNL